VCVSVRVRMLARNVYVSSHANEGGFWIRKRVCKVGTSSNLWWESLARTSASGAPVRLLLRLW